MTCTRATHHNRSSVPHLDGFFSPQGPIDPPDSVVDTRGAMLRQVTQAILKRRAGENRPGLDTGVAHHTHIVLFSRTRNRLVLNEREVIAGLVKAFGGATHANVTVLRMETHTFDEQVSVLQHASIAVGMHGSALIMAAFLPPGALLVELFPFGVPAHRYTPYKTMAALPGMYIDYIAWSNVNESASISHPTRDAATGGLGHLLQREQDRIMSTKEVPPHLCCTDPSWLYRIYQDTHVDVIELVAMIRSKRSVAVAPPAVPRMPVLVDGGASAAPHDQVHVHAQNAGGIQKPPVGNGVMHMTPGQVRTASCHLRAATDVGAGDETGYKDSTGGTLVIRWQAPFNIDWLTDAGLQTAWSDASTPGKGKVKYEVYVEELQNAWATTDTEVVIADARITVTGSAAADKIYTVWVRAVLDQNVSHDHVHGGTGASTTTAVGPWGSAASCTYE